MPRFFIESVDSEHVVIEGDDARHISLSLRMKRGDTVTLCSGGVDYICELDELSPEKVVCRVLEKNCAKTSRISISTFFRRCRREARRKRLYRNQSSWE